MHNEQLLQHIYRTEATNVLHVATKQLPLQLMTPPFSFYFSSLLLCPSFTSHNCATDDEAFHCSLFSVVNNYLRLLKRNNTA